MKHNFQDLKGRGDINLASGDEENHLPVFGDTGGAPQHREEGYMLMVDARPIPWTPREVANATTRMEAEIDDTETVGMQMWPHSAGDLFWESFPPLVRATAVGQNAEWNAVLAV